MSVHIIQRLFAECNNCGQSMKYLIGDSRGYLFKCLRCGIEVWVKIEKKEEDER
jgi:transcription elongation factor Elf1